MLALRYKPTHPYPDNFFPRSDCAMFEPLPDVIRRRRKERNLTQERLAKMAGVSRRQLHLLEEGHNVSLLFLLKVATALELTELPIAKLRLRAAPPELAALIAAADAVSSVKRVMSEFVSADAELDGACASLNALVARALSSAGSGDAIAAAAERLQSVAPAERHRVGATLRELAGETSRASRSQTAANNLARAAARASARRRARQ
jgi:transcriptional regulator with XRE-family HTH domain